MIESFLKRVLGIDLESEEEKQRKLAELEAARAKVELSRQRLMNGMASGVDEYAMALQLGEQMAKERGVDFNNYSTDIVRPLQENTPAVEIALILGAYISQAPIERMVAIPDNVIPMLYSITRSEEKLGRFDGENPQDNLAVRTVFEAMKQRMSEVRAGDQDFAGKVCANIENGFEKGPSLTRFSIDLISDMSCSTTLTERVISWRVLRKHSQLDTSLEVIKRDFQIDPGWSAAFTRKFVSILRDVNERERQGGANGGKVRELMNTMYQHKNELEDPRDPRDSLWTVVLDSLTENTEFYEQLKQQMPPEMRKEAARYKREADKRKEIEQGSTRMEDAIKLMDKPDREALVDYLENEDDEERDGMLATIFDIDDTNEIDTEYLFTARGRLRIRSKEVLLDPRVAKLFETIAMEENRDRFALELAVITSLMPIQHFPKELKLALKAYHLDTDQHLVALRGDWYLCSASEGRMLEDILAGNAILVDENMLVKFTGKKAALCLKTFTDASGDTFVKGVWYALTDTDSKKLLKAAFQRGEVKVNVGAKWAVMRAASDEGDYEAMSAQDLLAIGNYYKKWCTQQGFGRNKIDRSGSHHTKMGEAF